MKKKRIWKGLLLCMLGALLLAVLLQAGRNGKYADSDGSYKPVSSAVSWAHISWGVDYVLLWGDAEVRPVYAYRDSRTEAVIPKVHEILPFSELYAKTGCQFQSFNSIYQLCADKCTGWLEGVTDFLMIPEYLLWKLCVVKAKEYTNTNATTAGMVSAETDAFDAEIVSALGLPPIFPKLQRPGTVLGEYDGIKCVLCATHDTASAVEGIPMVENAHYIISGTGSLLGVKIPKPITDETSHAANYSNEGGVGYNRYQKTSWACGWSTSCKRSFAAGWAVRRP